MDSEADIFQYNGIIYQMNSERIDEKDLSLQEELFKISNQTDNPEDFSNRTANVLPVGTPIYSSGENGVLLADINGQILSYHAIIEG